MMSITAKSTLLGVVLLAGSAGPTLAERNPLRIDAPDRPRLADTTTPLLFACTDIEDCQMQAKAYCEDFNYPNGRILLSTLPASTPRPFPIYTVICFD